MTWPELVVWRAVLERQAKRSPATVDGYCKHVGWLATDAGPGPWEVTPAELAAWLDDHNWSAQTRRKVLVSLRAFYAWGVHEGQCQRSPLAGLSALPPRTRGPVRMSPSPGWVEPIAGFLTALEAGARQLSTLEQRRWWLTRLSETYADPWTVTYTDLALWLSRGDWAPETKRLARSSVMTFYRWAELSGRVPVSPARDLASVMIPRALPRPAPDDVVRDALNQGDGRVRLAVMIASYAGLRRSELVHLHVRDVEDDCLHVTGKGGHQRLVPLHSDLRAALRTELRRRRDGVWSEGWGSGVPDADGWLFPSGDPAKPMTAAHLAKLVAATLPEGWTTHTLRHRFATQAYRSGRDLRAVQELLGHIKPETTARYAAVPDGAIQAAVAGVGLRS